MKFLSSPLPLTQKTPPPTDSKDQTEKERSVPQYKDPRGRPPSPQEAPRNPRAPGPNGPIHLDIKKRPSKYFDTLRLPRIKEQCPSPSHPHRSNSVQTTHGPLRQKRPPEGGPLENFLFSSLSHSQTPLSTESKGEKEKERYAYQYKDPKSDFPVFMNLLGSHEHGPIHSDKKTSFKIL